MARRGYDTEIAAKVGKPAAAVFEYIAFWCSKSDEVHDGRRWIFHTLNQYKEHFPDLSLSTIRRALKTLETSGLIVTSCYNKMPFDRTKWYAVADEQIDVFKMNKSKCSKRTNRAVQNEQIDEVKMNTSDVFKMNTPITTNNKLINNTLRENNNSSRFTPPTAQDVRNYCNEKNISIDAERFVDYYASKGWLVGKAKMKDWRAAVRNWARNEKPKTPAPAIKAAAPVNEFDEMLKREGYL